MVHGVRASVSLTSGLVLGVLLSVLLFLPDELIPPRTSDEELPSEHWEVIIKKVATTANGQSQTRKVVRAGFAATELGIRDKLVVVILGQSSLMVALNASISRHVPHLQLFADISRIDGDIASLPNLTPYRLNGQHSHIPVLNLIFNMTMHEKFDWYYVIPDTTYVNPFELMRFVNHVDWNRRVVIGVGSGDDSSRCSLQAGILLTNFAMQSLIQYRHLCSSISSRSDHSAFELCIHLATNLSCTSHYQSQTYHWWKVVGLSEGGSGTAIHDTVGWWASSSQDFNRSLSVSPLLSDVDAHALHQHFLHVELNRTEYEIDRLSAEIVSLSYDITDGPSQPAGLPPYSKAPDRYQVPKWHFFTNTEIFKNEANQNVYALTGDDKLDVEEIVAAARKFIEESDEGSDEFLQLRNGYRLFDPLRGMDYIVDLLYRNKYGGKVHRVHLTRIISNNQLLQQVPYVKEDADLTILIPLGSNDEVGAVRRLIAHYVSLCQSSVGDNRQTRLIVAVRGVDPFVIRLINDDIVELRIRCKQAQTETMLLILKQDSHPVMAAAALDEAVDHFGQQMMYLLLSPHADIQHEFLDRVRINTIKHFQVFFPLPFVEYHPRIVSANEALQSKLKVLNVERAHEMGGIDQKARSLEINGADTFMSKFRDATFKRNIRPLIVHKDRGHFDPLDFSVFSLYGADFIQTRSRLNSKSLLLDLSSLFLGHQSIHMMRAVEPALRLRYHSRVCNPELVDTHYARCLLRRREGLASKTQLANLLLSRKARKMVVV
uniref:Hexosyltransferase n=1 Tax=Wuchereria bancrofti TaxID=6293 RepID=A0AAF5PPR1_WUCBA